MTHPHSNTAVERGPNSVWIETGQIINVDIAHWTVDVRTKNTHRQLLDKQVCAPYLHFNHGEGIYAMPEVGAKCMVCSPTDDEPFILCFITAFEREPSGEPSTQPEGDEEDGEAQSEVTFRAGRPKLQQGDIMMRTRDGNQLWLHRGGMVEIGATHMAKRVYIPIGNMIRDVFQNYQARSTAGDMTWKTLRSDTDPAGDAKTSFTLAARRFAQDEKASVLVQLGHAGEEEEGGVTHLRCVVAQDAIDPDTGEVEGEGAVYEFTVNEAGDVDVSVSGDVTMEITGNVDITCAGEGNLSFANLTQTISGDMTVQISGSHTLDAASSTENISGTKVINGSVHLGADGGTKVMLVTPSVIAFANHTHSITGAATGVPIPPLTESQMAATKVFGT